MVCNSGSHLFSYKLVEFKNGKHHLGKYCDKCRIRKFIKRKDLPSNYDYDSLPVIQSKNTKLKSIKKKSDKKKTDVVVLLRKKELKEKSVVTIKQTKTIIRTVSAYDTSKQKSFYETDSWRKIRYQALLKYGRKCMCCNAINVEIHVDHIKPRSLFPELELDINNLQILCKNCNFGKSNIDQTDFRINK